MGEKRKKSPEKYSEGSAEREERKAPGKRFLSSSGQERGRKRARVISSDEPSQDLAPKRLRSTENGEEQGLRKRAKVSSCEKRGKKRCRASKSEEDQGRQKRERRTSAENQSEKVVPARGRKRAKVISSDEPSQVLAPKRLRSTENKEEQGLRKRAKVSRCEKRVNPSGRNVRCVLKRRKPLGQCLADYKFHRILGRGAFGQVILASLKTNEQMVAVKVMEKTRSRNASVLTEKNVLQMAGGSPFLCRGLAAFQTQKHAYLVMEYMRGGSLGSFLESRKRLKMSAVRLLLAEIICGLQYLHSRGIIHRDLKPQNILLDAEGHVKIADFGLAAKNISESNKAHARVGTLLYMAPEILARKAYAGSVDWWSLGVILCHMLTGRYPFNNKGGRELYKRAVLNASPRYPEGLPGDAADLLNKLLDKNPETRLGEVGNIRDHPFFKSINWKRVERRQAVPPCRPFISQDKQPRSNGQYFIFMDDDSSVSEDCVIPGLSFVAPEWTG